MNAALENTHFCDLDHPAIQRRAARLSEKASDPVETVKNTFYFVRDNIVTGYDLYQLKASQVLKNGYGICWGKSLLLTALLRCNNIPAHFGTIPVHREFIRPLIGSLYRLANSPYNHCVVHAFVNNRWTILDPVLDKKTFHTFFAPVPVPWDIDWNGKDDCRLYTEHVAGKPVIHKDIDQTVINRAGNSEPPAFLARMANRFMNKRIWTQTGVMPHRQTV